MIPFLHCADRSIVMLALDMLTLDMHTKEWRSIGAKLWQMDWGGVQDRSRQAIAKRADALLAHLGF